MKLKKGILSLLGLFLMPLISAYNWGYNYSGLDRLLDNEWVVFGGIFILTFILVYIALVNFFTKTDKPQFPWEKGAKRVENQQALIILALVVAFFASAAVVRNAWMVGLFGEAVSSFILVLLFVVMVILIVPFYKALKKNIGRLPAILIFILALWFLIRYFFEPSQIVNLVPNFDISYKVYEVYDFVTQISTLVVALIFGVLYSFIPWGKKS